MVTLEYDLTGYNAERRAACMCRVARVCFGATKARATRVRGGVRLVIAFPSWDAKEVGEYERQWHKFTYRLDHHESGRSAQFLSYVPEIQFYNDQLEIRTKTEVGELALALMGIPDTTEEVEGLEEMMVGEPSRSLASFFSCEEDGGAQRLLDSFV